MLEQKKSSETSLGTSTMVMVIRRAFTTFYILVLASEGARLDGKYDLREAKLIRSSLIANATVDLFRSY